MLCFEIDLREKYAFLDGKNRNATLTCYLPNHLNEMNIIREKRPCILIIPGGGYKSCAEREAEPIALKFLNWGFNVFVLRYSVSPNRFPSQLLEVAASFEEIYKNSLNWNCDIKKIGIIGFSAGGHLAAHYSNAYNCQEIRKYFANSKKPDFNVLCYPVITTDIKYTHKNSIENLIGEYKDDARFSCEKLVTKDTPPTFIWHTAEDNIVPVMNSVCYASALAKNNVEFSLHIYPYGAHGLATCDNLTFEPEQINSRMCLASNWLEELKKWLDVQ